jgi:tripartite-type tricarboxylate transporter receptor subunit TctC
MLDRRSVIAAAAALGMPGIARAQRTGQATLVFPFAPGGAGDAVARLVADGLGQRLGERVIVDNRSGAGGRIGVMAVRAAPADGRTLLLTPIAPMAVYQHFDPNLAYRPFEDFAPVAQIATFDFGVAVHRDAPARDVRGLVDWVKSDPAKGSYGTPGAGTLPHFFAVIFGRQAGIDLTHVTYRGSAAAIGELIGGGLPMVFTTTSDFVPHAEAGAIRVLATSDKARSPFVRDVPTFREAGFPIEGTGWYGLYAPKATPADEVAKLAAIVADVVATDAVKARFAAFGLVPTGIGPAEFDRIQRADSALWEPAVKASGFRPG